MTVSQIGKFLAFFKVFFLNVTHWVYYQIETICSSFSFIVRFGDCIMQFFYLQYLMLGFVFTGSKPLA